MTLVRAGVVGWSLNWWPYLDLPARVSVDGGECRLDVCEVLVEGVACRMRSCAGLMSVLETDCRTDGWWNDL